MNRIGRAGVVSVVRTHLTDALRGITAAGVLLAAVVHLDLYEQGFGDLPTIGGLFLLDVVAGLAIGVGLLVWRHWIPTLFAAGFAAATLAAYWISVWHGLFGVKESVDGWPEITASVAEYTALAGGLAASALLAPARRWRRPS